MGLLRLDFGRRGFAQAAQTNTGSRLNAYSQKSLMAHFHLMHRIPDPRMHGLNGYKEVIETITWGLEQLGHRATYAVNEGAPGATNIVFGAQVMPVAALAELPPGTIIYNFEQLRDVAVERFGPKSGTTPRCRISSSGITALPTYRAGALSGATTLRSFRLATRRS